MEATRTTKACGFDSLALYREDLEHLVNIFKEAAPDSIVSLEDEETIYPSFDELRVQKGDTITRLRIVNSQVGIKFQMNGTPLISPFTKPTLATTNVTDEADLTFYRAQEFLVSKTRPSQYWIGTVLPVASLVVLALSVSPMYRHRNEAGNVWLFLLMLLDAFAFVSLVIKGAFKSGVAYLFTLKRQHEDTSFLKRNRDAVILSLFFFGLGIVATLFLSQFLK